MQLLRSAHSAGSTSVPTADVLTLRCSVTTLTTVAILPTKEDVVFTIYLDTSPTNWHNQTVS